MRRGPAVFILLCFLLAVGYGAQRALAEGWARVAHFSPAYFDTQRRPTTGPPPLAARLVVIAVDGLRAEDAPLLPTLDLLMRQGAGYRLQVPAPSYQPPVAATLLTGAYPTTHGVLLPGTGGALGADHLLAAAQRAKIPTGGAGGKALGTMLGKQIDSWKQVDAPENIVTPARALLAAGGPRLVLIQLETLVRGSHQLTGNDPQSPYYKDALAELDAQLIQLVEVVDRKTTAVLVVGTPAGQGDAAPVPLIMAGPGVREGFRGDGSLLDVAPTASALIGAPVPMQTQGKPLIAGLKAEGRSADVIAQRWLESRKLQADAVLTALGGQEPAPDAPTRLADAESYGKALDLQVETARFEAWKQDLVRRAPYLGGAILLLVLYLIISWRQPFGGAIFLGSVTFGLAFNGLFYATGGRYSAAMAGLASGPIAALTSILWRSAVAMLLSVMLTGYLLSRRGFKKRAYIMGAAMHLGLSTAALVALPVAVAVAFTGWDFPLGLPSPGLLVWFFATALQVMLIGYLSLVWGAAAVSAAKLSARWWPLKEVGDPERNADKVVRLRTLRRSVKR